MPAPANPNLFDPPSAHQLADHLAAHPPVRSANWHLRLPIIMIVVLGMTLLLMSSPAFALLPWLALLGAMVYITSRVRAMRELQQRVTRAWELAMIRRYREALGHAWDLLPACRSQPELHGRVVTVIAHILGELNQDNAAEVAYGYLLDRLPTDHPLSLRLKVQRAVAALSAGRLADADEALRKLRGPAEASKDPALGAAYRLARLVQDVRTGHYADAVKTADETADKLRPLGIEAGYGHGLLAYCCDRLAERSTSIDETTRQQLTHQARAWWDKATLLIPPAALVYRYPELRHVTTTTHGTTT